jgi:membrane protease YdiL (CAAX protease family)
VNIERKKILAYASAVLLTTTAVMGLFAALKITSNWAANALMVVPALAAIALRIFYGEGFRSVGWRAGRPIYWMWAILLPTLALAIWVPTSIVLGYAAMAPSDSTGGALMAHPLRLLENMAIYLAISIPLAFAEEFGWRGYLQAKVVSEFGLVKGLVVLGLIWGFWHSPIFYVMGNYTEHPLLGPFVMTPIDNLMAVVPMAWLYIRARNIWVPTLTHAFADILWGFSGILFPPNQEIASWAVQQTVQLGFSVVLLMDLRARPVGASGHSRGVSHAS